MLQRVDWKKSQYQTPSLPAIPERVMGKAAFSCLTHRDQAEWTFLFEEIASIPSPYANNQDFDFDTIAPDRWRKVVVPGSLILQGFDIENNTEYYYRRKISIPDSFAQKRVFLRFEGVYSNARVWVNNQFLKTHIGGFTAWDCEITPFAHEKEIMLVVGVTDVEGERKGIWNPEGEKISNTAWASYYAHCNIGGILREITLFALPNPHIARTYIDTEIKDDAQAVVHVECEIEACGQPGSIQAELLTLDGEPVTQLSGEINEFFLLNDTIQDTSVLIPDQKWRRKFPKSAANDQKYAQFFLPNIARPHEDEKRYGVRFSLLVKNAKLWDAEHPNLYQLKVSLHAGGKAMQENRHLVGIRQITYGGDRGTERNKVYINGREIKLHGLCHHDVSHLYGRSLSREEIDYEILTYKQHNINHIRTSHYPASDYFLEVCDRLGIYVEQENAACFKGDNGFGIYNPPQDFLAGFAEMIEGARNHPSVIIWSLANESSFEKTYAFRAEYRYVKDVDRTRPVIFSYPRTVRTKPLPYDIFSWHYQKVTGRLGSHKMPVLHDEFAHVSCYNIENLKEENSSRAFWGESIRRGWERIFHTDGALGCAIWAGIDDVFYLPEGTHERHQSHTNTKCAGYGEWGCIFDAYKRLKPEAYLTKKAFTPILLDESKTRVGKELQLYITNRFDHVCLTEVHITVSDKAGHILYHSFIHEAIEPHQSGWIRVPILQAEPLHICFHYNGYLVDEYTFQPAELHLKKSAPMIRKRNLSYQWQQQHTDFTILRDGEKAVSGPFLTFQNREKPAQISTVRIHKIRQSENRISAEIACSKLQKFALDLEWRAGRLEVDIRPKNIFARRLIGGSLVLNFHLFDQVHSICWHRAAPYSCYPPGHIARPSGTAYASGGAPNQYGEKPDHSWEMDRINFFLSEDINPLYSVTNDFKTKRDNIRDYTVCFQSGYQLYMQTQDSGFNAYVRRGEHDQLQVTLGQYYPDLKWGNYLGKPLLPNRKLHFSICLKEGRESL